MPALDPTIAMHRLPIEPDRLTVKQAPKCMHPDLAAKLEAEVDKVVTTGFIQEVQYPLWLTNIARSRRRTSYSESTSTFEILIKLAPKTIFLPPHMELIIDATVCYEALSFMDGYSRYSHIMHPDAQQ